MKAPRALLLAVALAAASPAIAQTTGQRILHNPDPERRRTPRRPASRPTTRTSPNPRASSKNFTCLDKFFNGTGLNVVVNLLNPTTLLNAVESAICDKLTSIWHSPIGEAQCGITLTDCKISLPQAAARSAAASPTEDLARRRRPDHHVDQRRSNQQRQDLDHRRRRRADQLLDHIPSRSLLRISVHAQIPIAFVSRLRRSVRRARVRGLARLRPDRRLRLGATTPCRSPSKRSSRRCPIRSPRSPTRLTATGPLGTLLGTAQYGSVTALLQQGFTQNANYAKAAVDAQSQIVDGALTSNARFQRDIRNAGIRDRSHDEFAYCAALDSGESVTVAAARAGKSLSPSRTSPTRGGRGPTSPAFYGQSQAIAAIAQLHFSRYCAPPEATAGAMLPFLDPKRRSARLDLFGTGTLFGQAWR